MEWGSALAALAGGIGVFLTTQLTNFFDHRRALQKEAEQWKRQQETEENLRKREEAIAERQLARDIYRNCISRLSLIASLQGNDLEMAKEEKLKLYKDAFEWLALLEMQSNSLEREEQYHFHSMVDNFTMRPASFAIFLLDEVKRMAASDRMLVPDHLRPKKRNPNERRVQVDLDKDFRRLKAIEGKELRKSHMFNCDISSLTSSQREKLWDMHYERHGGIPPTIYLSTPVFDERTKQVILKGPGIWKASLDPTACSAQVIFNAWEVAFEEALELAERAKAQSRNNDPTTPPLP